MYKNILEMIENFNTTPFLFVGSGITRRYYNLPNWKGLLEVFIKKISDDEFAFASYENKAKELISNDNGLYPKIADLVEKDFNKLWFENPSIRSLNEELLEEVRNNGVSPFKAEIAMYISDNSNIVNEYKDEIEKLKEISVKSISGIITTNYDNFFENTFSGYKRYVGQDELIFSGIQGIAEIYKIHGTIESPSSLIINTKDYDSFNEKSNYLAAKLMTVFMEHPIIFMGYSISDVNIQNILNSIIRCLSTEKISTLKERFIFIEYAPNIDDYELSEYTIKIENKHLTMTKIKMKDFSVLYEALSKKKNKIPVKLLRCFKEELYNFIINNKPTNTIKVGNIEDERISDDELVIAIGTMGEIGFSGLKGFSANDWYRDIVMNDKKFKAEDILENIAIDLQKQNSNRLPLNKFLSESERRFPDFESIARSNDFENIISKSLKKYRKSRSYNSIEEILEQNDKKSIILDKIACLEESQIDVDKLEEILCSIFKNNSNILEDKDESNIKSSLRRAIRIYDYLKYGKIAKEPSQI